MGARIRNRSGHQVGPSGVPCECATRAASDDSVRWTAVRVGRPEAVPGYDAATRRQDTPPPALETEDRDRVRPVCLHEELAPATNARCSEHVCLLRDGKADWDVFETLCAWDQNAFGAGRVMRVPTIRAAVSGMITTLITSDLPQEY